MAIQIATGKEAIVAGKSSKIYVSQLRGIQALSADPAYNETTFEEFGTEGTLIEDSVFINVTGSLTQGVVSGSDKGEMTIDLIALLQNDVPRICFGPNPAKLEPVTLWFNIVDRYNRNNVLRTMLLKGTKITGPSTSIDTSAEAPRDFGLRASHKVELRGHKTMIEGFGTHDIFIGPSDTPDDTISVGTGGFWLEGMNANKYYRITADETTYPCGDFDAVSSATGERYDAVVITSAGSISIVQGGESTTGVAIPPSTADIDSEVGEDIWSFLCYVKVNETTGLVIVNNADISFPSAQNFVFAETSIILTGAQEGMFDYDYCAILHRNGSDVDTDLVTTNATQISFIAGEVTGCVEAIHFVNTITW